MHRGRNQATMNNDNIVLTLLNEIVDLVNCEGVDGLFMDGGKKKRFD